MKCLSVRQPWASLIAAGRKTIEVRTWSTRYRGPLLICASQSPRLDGLPSGVAMCLVNLVDVRPIQPADSTATCTAVDPDRQFAWVLERPRALEFLTPVSGKLGLFSPPDDLRVAVS